MGMRRPDQYPPVAKELAAQRANLDHSNLEEGTLRIAQAPNHVARWRTLLILPLIVMTLLSPTRPAAASDASCSPDLSRWEANFVHQTTASPMRGVHGRIQKVPMTPSGTGVTAAPLWAFNGNSTVWWMEIGYGYNVGSAIYGPYWYEYHVNGAGAFYTVDLPWNASADYSLHDVTIKWIGSGGAYYGYIDGSVAVYATGYDDVGIRSRSIGIEAASCHSVIDSTQFDQFTDQAWDTSWGPSIYGTAEVTPGASPPVSAGWYSTYNWGWAQSHY